MNISNLSEQVDIDIPLLLAGPIIRRVEKSKVSIWISTSKKVQAKIRVFRINSQADYGQKDSNENVLTNQDDALLKAQPNLQLVGEGISSPLKLGDNLYVNLIIARPLNWQGAKGVLQTDDTSLEFPTNELLAYDLELISPPETGVKQIISLKNLGLLSGVNSIIYTHDNLIPHSTGNIIDGSNYGFNYPDLPTFFIPETADSSSLILLYGSCRKLHGDDEDSLIIGDKLMQDFSYDLNRRPSALFLIGDQIYADDVAGPLITFIKKFSSKLLGWEEIIGGLKKNLNELNVGERKEIVQKYANFSTDVGENHLLGFGEFAAMYLLAWNQLIWPEQFEQQPISNLSNSSSLKKYQNELKELEQSRRTLVGVRRLLANIPTYMICDDHEITDDWNINRKWRDEVDQSSCGKQIISNGLLAYWAFQAWGNDPDSFDTDFIEEVKHYLDLKKQLGTSLSGLQTRTKGSFSETPFNPKSKSVDLSLIQDVGENILLTKNWTFVAPTHPLSIFLDCRTQRTFVDEEGPPHLLSEDALDYVKSSLMKIKYKNGDPLIMISPTPVFGFELAESVQRFLTTISGSYKWDLETWRSNEIGFTKFLTYLALNFNPIYCIFLSGDVHYAFTMKAHFDRLKLPIEIGSPRELNTDMKIKSVIPMAQLTSSPFRSNSLTNRIAAILILNLAHKVIVSKKFLLRKVLVNNGLNEDNLNYDYFKRLPDANHHRMYSNEYDNNNIHFSKHGDKKSIFEKIKVIMFNLKVKYFRKKKNERNRLNSPWAEHRLLIKPKGQGSLPVLAKNNIGYIYLDLNSKSIEHILYYLNKDKMENSQSFINFQT